MDGARVGIFEDNGDWLEILEEIIEDNGHLVAVSASSMEEARVAIDGLEDGSLDIALVDGNLDPKTTTGDDGAEVTRLLRGKFGATVTVIGFSATNDIEGVDRSVKKTGDPMVEIPAIIAEVKQK